MGEAAGMIATDRKPTMITCPVCGYDPDPPVNPLSMQELWKQRIYAIFRINAHQPWWVEQTRYISCWLRDCGMNPKKILDIGCGDGRWIYGIKAMFPQAQYTGIDRLEDHIMLNKEKLPEIDWVYGDFCHYKPEISPDTILIMGTLNPAMPMPDQDKMFDKVNLLAPENIVCLFDLNSPGHKPDAWLKEKYLKINALSVQEQYRGPQQDLMVWRYVRK